jgi:hypothetical protein
MTASPVPPTSGGEPSLHKELYSSAGRFAHTALRALADGDTATFLLHAGTAIEHLTKSFLASLHGSLIASTSPRHFRSLLFLSGLEKEAGLKRSQIRTISMEEAINRAGVIVPQFANFRDPLQPLVDGRNSVAHSAALDAGAADTAALPFLRGCDLLLERMLVDRATFWGDLLEVVDAREAASAEAAKISALEKIAAARAAFASRYGALNDDVRAAMLATISGSYAPEKYEQTLHECPACGTEALVEGTIEVEWKPDWDYADGESYVAGAYPEVTIFPQRLECRACGLELEGESELAAAEVTKSWELDDIDPDHFREEPDYDWDDV